MALNYYLTGDKHLDKFLAFCTELNNMPRDLEMDEQTVLLTFAKAFKVANADGTGLDDKKFTDLAEEWFHLIKVAEAPFKDIKLTEPARHNPAGDRPAGRADGTGRHAQPQCGRRANRAVVSIGKPLFPSFTGLPGVKPRQAFFVFPADVRQRSRHSPSSRQLPRIRTACVIGAG